jgi:YebC/PmpR family DNA-binding regulatory protein
MSGHSKWHSIKHKKAATDKERGKVFGKHAKLIAVAARKGGDPGMNPSLRTAIDNARAENMPFDNIDRAVKKGSGDSKNAVQFDEVIYEAYGPGGVAMMIETLTDNRNRTVANVKIIVSKKGGNMGASGSVSYLFKKVGLIEIIPGQKSSDEIELTAIDSGADDIKAGDDMIEVYTDPQNLMQVKKKLEDGGIKAARARLTYVAQTETAIKDTETAKKLLDLVEALEEDEDVTCVYSNEVIAPEVLEKIED